jgi:hypothetical protein
MIGQAPENSRSNLKMPRSEQPSPAGENMQNTREILSLCDIVCRLCPGIDRRKLRRRINREGLRRCERLARLRRQVRQGIYELPPETIAAAMLREKRAAPEPSGSSWRQV